MNLGHPETESIQVLSIQVSLNLYSLDLKLRLRNPEVELIDSIRRQADQIWNPPGNTGRRGALVSTKQVGTLQADTDKTWCISEHKNRLGPLQTDAVH